MRQFHWWVSVVTAIFLLMVSATGVTLQVQKLLDGEADAQPSVVDLAKSGLATALTPQSLSDIGGTCGSATAMPKRKSRVRQCVEKISNEEKWIPRLQSGDIRVQARNRWHGTGANHRSSADAVIDLLRAGIRSLRSGAEW